MYGSVIQNATSTKNSVNYIYGNTKSAVSRLNNIHISLHNFYFSNSAGNYYQSNVNFMGYYVNNCNITDGDKKYITTIFNNSNTTTPVTINEFTCVVDKDKDIVSNSYIKDIYVGGVSNASDGSLLNFNVKKASVYVDNAGEVRNIYGGGNQIGTLINVDELYYKINSGKVGNIYGGGLGGFVGTSNNKAKITIDIDGGSVNNVFGGGSGGLVNLYKTNGPNNLTDTTASVKVYKTSNEYGNDIPQFITKGSTPVISAFVTKKNDYMPFTLSDYIIKETGISYQCTQVMIVIIII